MKNVLRLLTYAAVVASFALPAFAQTTQPTPAATPNPVCADLYNKWRENSAKGTTAVQQKTAYDTGKQFLSQCGSDEFVSYVQRWVTKYEKAALGTEFENALSASNHTKSFELGRQVLRDDPENMRVLLNLAYAGLLNATSGANANASLDADAMNYAQKAIQLIQAGKAPQTLDASGKMVDNWLPFTNKDDALGWLNYALGVHSFKRATGESANYFIKAAQANSTTKKDPSTYYYLATAYQKAEYKPLADDYQATCAGKDLTDECKNKLNTMNLVVDRVIDAYARAIALAGTNAKYQTQKAEWTKQVTGFYKFRNNDSEAGLNELIAGIQSKPLLLPGMQTTPAPAPATTTTPAAAPSTSNVPPGGNGVTSTTTTTTTTTPAASSATKPKTTSAQPVQPARSAGRP